MTAQLLLDIQHASTLAIPSAEQIQRWAELALGDFLLSQADDQEVTLRFVDADESQQLNFTYRKKNYATNVLSFPFEQAPGLSLPLLGDLVLCVPVILEEAQQQGKTTEAHWAHIIIHGLLHLLGHDHIEPEQADAMETLEITLLAKLGYANPYLWQPE